MSGLEMIPHVLRAFARHGRHHDQRRADGRERHQGPARRRVRLRDEAVRPAPRRGGRRAARSNTTTCATRSGATRTYLEEMVEQRTAELDRALDSLDDAYRTTLKALTAALETRDPETHGHSERVVNFQPPAGPRAGPRRRAVALAGVRLAPARHRQDRRARRHPAQARQARRGRVGAGCASTRCTGRRSCAA